MLTRSSHVCAMLSLMLAHVWPYVMFAPCLALCSLMYGLMLAPVAHILADVGPMLALLAPVAHILADVGPMLADILADVGPILAHVGPILAICWPMQPTSWPMLALCWRRFAPVLALC